MGEHQIHETSGSAEMRTFVRAVLEDLAALERMIATEGMFESGVRCIGAEQEMFLVDRGMHPTNKALQILERLPSESFTTELGQFNLEANLSPLALEGECLSQLEEELNCFVAKARVAARSEDARVVLTGILPTLEKTDLTLESMTPMPRYYQLNQVMRDLRGGEFRTYIKGLDELQTTHDNVMLEACNTSFQIHFQVAPEEFATLYNIAQVVMAPVLAAAVNSPVLLQHRLWHETRVALFQQSVDTRSELHAQRGGRVRVSFGDDWVHKSVIEIFREDIARFRALIASDIEESPLAKLERGEIPELKALRLHNGTIYRWNRPCYGVANGRPHLRIENRVLPAGPSILDEVANAAFYFGLMCGVSEEYGDVRTSMAFSDAKENFTAAARYGLRARLRWFGGESYGAETLILDHLLPLAEKGLNDRGLRSDDVERYLGVIRERVGKGRTGSQWMLDSLESMRDARSDEAYRALTATMTEEQEAGAPVHEWPLARVAGTEDIRDSYRTVSQVMTRDLFTVHPEDLLDLAASVMDWEHLRHVPVEDQEGRLVGLVTYRTLLRIFGRRERRETVAVSDVMRRNPNTIRPEASVSEAIRTMRENKLGCLPVVEDGRLVGIVTESDFMEVAARLLEEWLQRD
ncbi:MAG TPA: CBS domain-containing protein [Planctomycetes bacterium]|nr:CBS domain-containing protein [Planctomycetota bacterium]